MRWVSQLSNAALSVEKWLVTFLAATLVLLILLNIVTRSAGAAIFWVDELAVYTMIWMALIGASAMVGMRYGVAVTLLTDLLPPFYRRAVAGVVDGIILLFAVILLILCWRWYDPVTLARSGFDTQMFAQDTFNFIYDEPTTTVGIRKFWVWLAAPLMAVNMTLHAVANLLGPRPKASEPRSDEGMLGEA